MSYALVKFKEKSQHQRDVEKFMELAGQEVPKVPTVPSVEVRRLRARLILEECLETIAALGFYLKHEAFNSIEVVNSLVPFVNPDISLVDITDGCCDIAVVTTGTLSACGIADIGPQNLINQSNLKKFGPGGYRDIHGKWIKPKGWKAPDLFSELSLQAEL